MAMAFLAIFLMDDHVAGKKLLSNCCEMYNFGYSRTHSKDFVEGLCKKK